MSDDSTTCKIKKFYIIANPTTKLKKSTVFNLFEIRNQNILQNKKRDTKIVQVNSGENYSKELQIRWASSLDIGKKEVMEDFVQIYQDKENQFGFFAV